MFGYLIMECIVLNQLVENLLFDCFHLHMVSKRNNSNLESTHKAHYILELFQFIGFASSDKEKKCIY